MEYQQKNNELNTARLHAVFAYINEQIVHDWAGDKQSFAEATSIERILQQADREFISSRRHFQHIFLRMTGESIGAYINNLRLEQAAHLLRNTNLPVMHIANTVGYESENALFRPFKRRFHITPLQFREQATAPSADSSPTPAGLAPEGAFCLLPPQYMIYRTYVGDYSKYTTAAFDEEARASLYEYAQAHAILPPKPDYYGICLDDSNLRQPNRCRFYACMTVNHAPTKADPLIRPLRIKEGKYRRYKYVGSYTGLDAFYQSIFRHFDYELRDDFILEHYLNSPQEVTEAALETEILVPVVR